MINSIVFGLLFAVVVLSQQQQPVDAWWMFSDPTTAPATKPIKAVANFNMDTVRGSFRCTQNSPSEATKCDYELQGLKGNNNLYHVHVRPVPSFDPERIRYNATAMAELCADPATGGHLNPHHVTQKLPPKSAPLDKYETGDLSGKHGPLTPTKGKEDHYSGSFVDDKLPMSGENSMIGRSIVIHKNDGKRWVCANIVSVN